MKLEQTLQNKPPRLLLYGAEKTGKSTTAAFAPKPVFIRTEDGLGSIDATAFPLAKQFGDVTAALEQLATEDHEFGTVVIDSADAMEAMLFERIITEEGVASMELAHGGYGKAYGVARTLWRNEVLTPLDYLRDHKNMMVIMLAHHKVKPVLDPLAEEYQRYSPNLHSNKTGEGILSDTMAWLDGIFFLNQKIVVRNTGTSEKKENRAVDISGGKRTLHTVGNAGFIAGNRYGLPAELPLPKENPFGPFLAAYIEATNPQQPQLITETNQEAA